MKNKYKILSLLCLTTIFVLGGCSSNTPNIKSDGTLVELSEKELVSDRFYIKKEDGYYPLLDYGISTSPIFHQWFTEYGNAIPEINKGDELIYYSEFDFPTKVDFIKMKDLGYTLGLRFDVTDADISFSNDTKNDFCIDSSSFNVIEKIQNSNNLIKEINNMEFKTSMLTADGYLKGLTRDALYRIGFYKGTTYQEIDLIADTRLFVEENTFESDSFIKNKGKFFTVNIPSSMPTGYYSLNRMGLFKLNTTYEESDKLVEEDKGENTENVDKKEEKK